MAKLLFKRVGVISVSMWQTPVYMVIGLLFAVVLGLHSMVSGELGFLSSLKYIVGMVIGYGGVGGFIATAIGCIVFNAVNRITGGISLEVEYPSTLPPPPPQRW